MHSDNIKYLHVREVRRREPLRFVGRDALDELSGFRSVFGYRPEVWAEILDRGHMRELHGISVYADELLIDFDNNDRAAYKFAVWVLDNDYQYQLYPSGNRSWHFHLPTVPAEGCHIPHLHKSWAKRYAPGCDTTIYRPGGLFRLPGTWHEKRPGHRKHLAEAKYEGRLLDLNQFTPPTPPPAPCLEFGPEMAELKLQIGLQTSRQEGGRRCYVWYLAKMAAIAGMPAERASELIEIWNTSKCSPPLPTSIVAQKITEAYSD